MRASFVRQEEQKESLSQFTTLLASMRSNRLYSLLLAASLTSSVLASQQSFFPVQTAQAKVVRRQECIANFYSCADKGETFNGVCCQNGQKCELLHLQTC